jgi:hypothetical protein
MGKEVEKQLGEDDIKGLEEEIDLAVDRLFVDKNKGQAESARVAPQGSAPPLQKEERLQARNPASASSLPPFDPNVVEPEETDLFSLDEKSEKEPPSFRLPASAPAQKTTEPEEADLFSLDESRNEEISLPMPPVPPSAMKSVAPAEPEETDIFSLDEESETSSVTPPLSPSAKKKAEPAKSTETDLFSLDESRNEEISVSLPAVPPPAKKTVVPTEPEETDLFSLDKNPDMKRPSFTPPVPPPVPKIAKPEETPRVSMDEKIDEKTTFPTSSSKTIEIMETHLLALEWDINEENLEKTRKGVITLKETLQEKPNVISILNLMERVLSHMIENEENIRPPLIKFLLDAKETIKLLLKKETGGELRLYKQLAYFGIDARFHCLDEFRDADLIPPTPKPVQEEPKLTEAKAEEAKIEGSWKRIEEMLNKMDAYTHEAHEALRRIDQSLSQGKSISTQAAGESPAAVASAGSITVVKIDNQLFGVQSDKVVKLLKVPEPLHEKYSKEKKIRLKEFEVKMIDLKKVLSIPGERSRKTFKILAVKEADEYKGLMIDQVLKKLIIPFEGEEENNDYFIGKVHWTYENHPTDVPILNLKRF